MNMNMIIDRSLRSILAYDSFVTSLPSKLQAKLPNKNRNRAVFDKFYFEGGGYLVFQASLEFIG
jgi:hypothetical protein